MASIVGKDKEKKIRNSYVTTKSVTVPFSYGLGTNVFSYSVTGKAYIPFVGLDDYLPVQLFEARLNSTTQSQCLQSIVGSVIGKGYVPEDGVTLNKDFENWMHNINAHSDNFTEFCRKVSDGFFNYGNVFIEIVKGNIANKKFVKLYVHSILYARIGKVDFDTNLPKTVIFSRNFAKKGMLNRLSNETEIPLYNINNLLETDNWFVDKNGLSRTCIHFKNEVAGFDFYGLPPSIAGLRYQILEGKAAQYNIDNFDNNMVLSGMLVFKSSMTQEEAQAIAKEVLDSHTGEGKIGRVAVISSESGLDDVNFKPYDTHKEGSFIEMDMQIEKKIVAANSWDKRLTGMDRDDGLGNGNNLSEIYDIKNLTVLEPFRERLNQRVIQPIFEILNKYSDIKTDGAKFKFEVSIPLSFYGKISPENYIKVNEARKMAKLPEDSTMDETYVGQNVIKKQINVSNKPA